MYTIPSQDYASFLKGASFANISTNSDNDNEIQSEFNNLTTPNVGWYVTSVFFKNTLKGKEKIIDDNNFYPHLKIFENKNLTEKKKGNKTGSKSDNQNFDDSFLKQVRSEIDVKDKIEGYFQFFFPVFVTLDTKIQAHLLIMLNLKKLPVDFYFEFQRSGNSINTYPRLNNNDAADKDKILTTGLTPVDQNYFEFKCYNISNLLNNSYSDIIKKLYIEGTNIPEISFGTTIDKIVFSKANTSLTIKKESTEAGKILRTENFINLDTTKKIIYNDKKNDDGRILYYQNCLDNNKTIAEDKKKKSGNTTENLNNISNYYDISFDCQQCKTFLISNFTPGYHVLAYKPNLIYNFITETQDELTINFIDLYKDIFKNNIIEIEVENL